MSVETGWFVVTVLLVVVLVVRERDHDRRITAILASEASERARTARAHTEQVDRLCQRLQAPEQAVIEHSIGQVTEQPAAVTPDNDRDFWEAHMTKEQLAEALREAELHA